MQRLFNWATLLDIFFESRRSLPFAWGTNDCCMFGADAVQVMTGIDLASGFRGRYSDDRGMVEILDGMSVPELLEQELTVNNNLKVVAYQFGQRGDLALLSDEVSNGPALGVIDLTGLWIFAPGQHHLETWPVEVATRVWRI